MGGDYSFKFLHLISFWHLFGWVWVMGFISKIEFSIPHLYVHIDALFCLFSMNITYIHVPNITCRFTTPHSGPSICQLSFPASAELEQALVLPIDHVSNFEWPGPEVVHQLSWSHGVSTSINHGYRVIPTWSQPTLAWYNNIPSYSALWLG